jgi:hypothetical protein
MKQLRKWFVEENPDIQEAMDQELKEKDRQVASLNNNENYMEIVDTLRKEATSKGCWSSIHSVNQEKRDSSDEEVMIRDTDQHSEDYITKPVLEFNDDDASSQYTESDPMRSPGSTIITISETASLKPYEDKIDSPESKDSDLEITSTDQFNEYDSASPLDSPLLPRTPAGENPSSSDDLNTEHQYRLPVDQEQRPNLKRRLTQLKRKISQKFVRSNTGLFTKSPRISE